MIIPLILLSVSVLLLGFLKPKNDKQKRFRRGFFLYLIFQISFIVLGIGLLFFVPAIEEIKWFRGPDGLATLGAIMMWSAIILAIVAAIYFSKRRIQG